MEGTIFTLIVATSGPSYTPAKGRHVSARCVLVEGVLSSLKNLDGSRVILAYQNGDVFF